MEGGQTEPRPPDMLLTKVLRSPSRESVATDLSLLSLSSYGSDVSRISTLRPRSRSGSDLQEARGASPHAFRGHRHSLLQVPGENDARFPIPEVLFEEECDVIRSCGALSSALGLRRSFSTGDIVQGTDETNLRSATSEDILTGSGRVFDLATNRLDYASRSCSTWVAVGDVASTSQLPSPQGQPGPTGDSPAITPADLIRSVNKKVRHSYIQRRLLTTYMALERCTQSELSLDRKELGLPGHISKTQLSRELLRMLRKDSTDTSTGNLKEPARTLSLTVKDVERERGKPLTKYERNMMIFNWLHSLEDDGLAM